MMRIPALCLYVLILSVGLPAFGQEPSPPETVAEPEPISLPCPEGFTCQDDGILVALITQLDQSLSALPTQGPGATLRLIREMQATQDPRLVPVYERLLRGSNKAISLATLQALSSLSALPQVERIASDLVASTKSAVLLNAALNLLFQCELDRQAQALPCPTDGNCAPDPEVLHALMALQNADSAARLNAIAHIGTLKDDRLLPFVLRISMSSRPEVRSSALQAVSHYRNNETANQRLMDAFTGTNASDRLAGLRGLAKDDSAKMTDFLLDHRVNNPKDPLRKDIEKLLQERSPKKLGAILSEERRIEAERLRRLEEAAKLKALEPNIFDKSTRGILTGTNALSAAIAGATVANLTADAAGGSEDGDLGTLAACWGCGVGAAAAGTLSWFSLADRELKSEDLNLALSTGAWSGLSTYQLINFIATQRNSIYGFDQRHYLYGVPTGVLLGSWAGTLASLNTDMTHSDVGEIHAAVLMNNLLLGGIALTVPDNQQGLWYPWTQILGTAAGYGLVLPLYKHIELDAKGWGQTALGALAGLVAGGLYGGSLSDGDGAKDKYTSSNTGAGYAMVGTALGGATGFAYRQWGKEDPTQLYAQTSLGLWGAAMAHYLPDIVLGQAPDYSRSRFYSTAVGYTTLSALSYIMAERQPYTDGGVTRLNMETLAGFWLATGIANSIPDLELSSQISHLASTAGIAAGLGVAAWQRNDAPMTKTDGINVTLNAATGLWAGLQLGVGLNNLDNRSFDPGAYALMGGGLGLALADFQNRHDKTPTEDGLLYQTWAGAMGNMMGAGVGLMLTSPVSDGGDADSSLAGLLGSTGLLLGAGSTVFFPDGVEQDRGDLVLNPMLMGLSAWHALAIGTGFNLSDEMSSGLLFTLPAVASTATVALAPRLNLSFGDILMITGSAAWGNLMGAGIAASLGHHMGGLSDLEAGLLSTGLLDLGMGIGFALTALDQPDLGWKFTYVASTTSIALLVASLPAALLTTGDNAPVALSDILIGASLLGTGAGVATLGLIDFRVAPDMGLSKKPSEDKKSEKDIILKPMDPKAKLPFKTLQPTMVAIPAMPGLEEKPQMGAGFVGTF